MQPVKRAAAEFDEERYKKARSEYLDLKYARKFHALKIPIKSIVDTGVIDAMKPITTKFEMSDPVLSIDEEDDDAFFISRNDYDVSRLKDFKCIETSRTSIKKIYDTKKIYINVIDDENSGLFNDLKAELAKKFKIGVIRKNSMIIVKDLPIDMKDQPKYSKCWSVGYCK